MYTLNNKFNLPQETQGRTLKCPLAPPVHPGAYPREDWQLDFTQMPKDKRVKYLLVFIDTFTEWIEAYPTKTERVSEVTKVLLKELIPSLAYPNSYKVIMDLTLYTRSPNN